MLLFFRMELFSIMVASKAQSPFFTCSISSYMSLDIIIVTCVAETAQTGVLKRDTHTGGRQESLKSEDLK